MDGDKLAYSKKALDFVIDNLTSDDCLSIVQYDNLIEVVSPSQKIQDKQKLHSLVKGIQARGMTNLSGGMQEGYKQVRTTQNKSFVNRVLLLSDGLANEGVTDNEQLQKIAQTRFRNDGIALSTFGVGADFNEVLMTNLSEYGSGNYYFIEKPDDIPAIFAKELTGLLSVVSQNTHLDIQFPERYVKFVKSYGYPVHTTGDKIHINFNDVFSEEKKGVLLKFEVVTPFESAIDFSATLAFDDVVSTFSHQTNTYKLSISPTTDTESFRNTIQHSILEQVALFEANDMFEEAMRQVDQRNFDKAKEIIAQIKLYLDTHFQLMPPSEELKRQYETITNYQIQVDEMGEMSNDDFMMSQKMSRSANYALKKKK
jgi:Ca-activated chloride channel family protein